MVFHQLRRKDLAGIVEIQVGSLRKRMKARGLDLELTPAAVNALADEGYDPAFGARPLARLIQEPGACVARVIRSKPEVAAA